MTDARTNDTASEARTGSSGQSLLLVWGPTVLFGMVLPWITYNQLTGQGVPEVPALLIVAAWPALEIGLYFAVHRRADEFGMLILMALLLDAAGALAHHSSSMLFLKDSALTGLVGLTFLLSLGLPRPLIFYVGRKFATDSTADGVARWNDIWDVSSGFRSVQRRLTAIWGLVYLTEATVKAVLVYRLSAEAMSAVADVLPLAVTALLVAHTAGAGRKDATRVAGAAGVAAAQTPAAPSSTPTP